MDIQNQINAMRHQKLKQIELAAQDGNTSSIISLTADIEILEKLKRQLGDIEQAVYGLERKSSGTVPHATESSLSVSRFNYSHNASNNELSFKRIGEMNRLAFIRKAAEHGVPLSPVKGVLFRNSKNQLVGIAYASERQPNKWWLGLPVKEYGSFVLLCVNDRDQMTRFIFPAQFYLKYKNQFSRDKKSSQLKFNISHHDGIYTLSMSDQRHMRINEYIDAFDNFQS